MNKAFAPCGVIRQVVQADTKHTRCGGGRDRVDRPECSFADPMAQATGPVRALCGEAVPTQRMSRDMRVGDKQSAATTARHRMGLTDED